MSTTPAFHSIQLKRQLYISYTHLQKIQLFFCAHSLFIFLTLVIVESTCSFQRIKMVCRRSKIMHGNTKLRRGKGEMRGGLVHKKVKKLQKIVPGGQGLKPENLLLKTADYILFLRLQIKMLQCLSKLYTP